MSVKQKQTTTNIIDMLTTPKAVAIAGIGVAGAAYWAYRKLDVDKISSAMVPTEQAVSAFSILAGVGGAAAQLLAARRLSTVPGDSIPVTNLALPLTISIVASAGSAYFLPTGNG